MTTPMLKPVPDLPLVSVITPSFNTGRFIEETLRSVRDQGYPRIEHIVLDSGSTDGTLEILKRFPNVRLVTSAPPTLIGKMNLGFSMAQGDIVGWVCADDLYLPDAVAKGVEAFKSHPDVGMVYSNFLEVDEQGIEIGRKRSRQVGYREMRDQRLFAPIYGMFMRREVLEHVGPLDRRYPLVCDWDLEIRIAKLYPLKHIDDWWGAFRVHKAQRTELNKYEAWRQGREMTREHGGHYFSPVFWIYWGGKLGRGAQMLLRGQFSVFGSKLRDLCVGAGRSFLRRRQRQQHLSQQ